MNEFQITWVKNPIEDVLGVGSLDFFCDLFCLMYDPEILGGICGFYCISYAC